MGKNRISHTLKPFVQLLSVQRNIHLKKISKLNKINQIFRVNPLDMQSFHF